MTGETRVERLGSRGAGDVEAAPVRVRKVERNATNEHQIALCARHYYLVNSY